MASYRATSIYGNRSQTTRNNSGTWVYYNGELYHAGVKGMQWGKHLPGTDWWKKAVDNYRARNTVYTPYQKDSNGNTMPGSHRLVSAPSNFRTNLAVGAQAVKETARDFNRAAKYDASRSAGAAYNANFEKRYKDGLKGSTYLNKISSAFINSGFKYYQHMSGENSKWSNIINLAIRNAGFKVVDGINDFLVKHNWDKKVDAFIKKVLDTSRKAYNTVKTGATNAYNAVKTTATNVSNSVRNARMRRNANKNWGYGTH